MVGILVDAKTERLRYTLDFIFKERGVDYEITTSVREINEGAFSFRLNYSSRSVEGIKQIVPATLLAETSVLNQNPEKANFEKVDCLSFSGVTDPIASVFYVLTRYEEYAVTRKDEHGRFSPDFSIQKKYDWMQKAVCDRWARVVLEFIHTDLFMDNQLKLSMGGGPKMVPTFDIDNAFAYKHKTGNRKILSTIRDMIRFDFNRLSERRLVNSGDKKDPYDTYDNINEIARNFDCTHLFWLMRSNGNKDRNLSLECPSHKELIKHMAEKAEIGVHPSYGSFENTYAIRQERSELEAILDKRINSARFHFLRFRLPQSYRNLIESGITHDYSMGYAADTGFRAGTARTHFWFDLDRNERTELRIHPFVYMDGTLNEYLNLSLKEAEERIQMLYDEVKENGGEYCFIWHNETIGDYGKWKGWSSILENTLKMK